jgi:NhaA family Na+:H+ antiporter
MKQDRIDIWLQPVNKFVKNETAGGIVLFGAAVLALIVANSPLQDIYHQLWQYPFGFTFAGIEISKTLHHWINDGLMSVFFFVVGLELKREIIAGELSNLRKAALPLAAGAGGMIFPAAIYVFFNLGTPGINGWGIPMATDIAFALGILYLLGSRVPISLKVFLTALAIADDIGAVLVIAFFYTSDISLLSLGIGSIFMAVLIGGNLAGIRTPLFYGIIGIGGLWMAFLLSGVHATIAGILAALTIPATVKIDSESFLSNLRTLADKFGKEKPGINNLVSYEQLHIIDNIKRYTRAVESPLQRLEHGMHSIVAFIVLPVFAFANAGITVTSDLFAQIASTITLGVWAGLTVGKTVGIILMSKLVVYLNLAELPAGSSWRQIYAVSFLASIGFTMSIFITELAFDDAQMILQAKLGIFIASGIGAVVGYLMLRTTPEEIDHPAGKREVEV